MPGNFYTYVENSYTYSSTSTGWQTHIDPYRHRIFYSPHRYYIDKKRGEINSWAKLLGIDIEIVMEG